MNRATNSFTRGLEVIEDWLIRLAAVTARKLLQAEIGIPEKKQWKVLAAKWLEKVAGASHHKEVLSLWCWAGTCRVHGEVSGLWSC